MTCSTRPSRKERTDEHLRFEVEVPARGETKLRVQERRLLRRREELQKQSLRGSAALPAARALIDQRTYDQVAEAVAPLWEKIGDNEKRIKEVEKERQKLYKAQTADPGQHGRAVDDGQGGDLARPLRGAAGGQRGSAQGAQRAGSRL